MEEETIQPQPPQPPKRLNINDANTYLLQDKFDKIAEQAMEKWNIDKEVFADLCLFWVRYNAKWNK